MSYAFEMSQLDYAIIGNCQISALIDKSANYVWCCMPRFDSPSVFSQILDTESAGHWSCMPANGLTESFTSKQQYIRNTNVLSTIFELKNGDQFEVIDFAPRFQIGDHYFREPCLIRILRPLKGNPHVQMELLPKFNYGSIAAHIVPTGDGILYEGDGHKLFFKTDIPHNYILNKSAFTLSTTKYAVLSYGKPFEEPLRFAAEEYLDRTISYWRLWVKHSSIPFEFQNEVIRSSLALKLHIFDDTGAVIAATTTSIPESPDGGRCWDYRYCWLRDAYFVINTLNKLGHFDEMEHFIEYLHNIALNEKSLHLQPVYGIGGEQSLEERELPWLKGFHGFGPVRIGNAAYTHHQYDVYGEMVLATTPLFFDERLNRHDMKRTFQTIKKLVEQAIKTFDLADAGLWEFRSANKHYLFSKLLNWAAVDRGIKIAQKLGEKDLSAEWIIQRKRMRDTIDQHGWNEDKGIFTQFLGGTTPDASNLLIANLNYLPSTSPRFEKMVNQYEKMLRRNQLTYRYIDRDDFGVPQTAFTICSFWMVEALYSIGRQQEARELFQLLCSKVNHVGLLSEDLDPITGELWGNFPQTYSHVGLINCAMKLSKSWDEAF